MDTFDTSRLKTSLRYFWAIVPIAYGVGLILSFCDAHFVWSQSFEHWFYDLYMAGILALLIFSFVLLPILLQDGPTGVQVISTGLTLVARSRNRSGCMDTFYEIPWNAIREVRMKPAFPKFLKMVDIQLLCIEEGIAVNSFLPFGGKKRVRLTYPKGGPKTFAYAYREFPSGLIIFSLPWQLKRPHEFKVAVLQEAPFEHPLAQFFREHPDLVQ